MTIKHLDNVYEMSLKKLRETIYNEDAEINLRACAARELIVKSKDPKDFETLKDHKSYLIKLGAVIGAGMSIRKAYLEYFANTDGVDERLKSEALDWLEDFEDVLDDGEEQ